MIWADRGPLTARKVYWGPASDESDPLARIPVPPFAKFERDTTRNARSPKAKLTDKNGVKWTVKFGTEIHSDVAAPHLAWALGFGTVESYFVKSGQIDGVTPKTNLGSTHGWILQNGRFIGGARFRRHNKGEVEVKDEHGNDLTWSQARNPGVPPEQLSGMLILDVMLNNWDAQPKNCKVVHIKGRPEPQNWYFVSDYGASFADRPWNRFDLEKYAREKSFIKQISNGYVDMSYANSIHSLAPIHRRIPLSHAQWFRPQLAKLSNDDIQAAFDAAFATNALNKAYAKGDPALIKRTREREVNTSDRATIAGFVSAFRARINEFLTKVPAG